MGQRESQRDRVNSWTKQADETLAQVVIQCIQTGQTQLKGLERAAELLHRTVGACGFRWNGVVRKRFRNEIQQAKLVKATRRSLITNPPMDKHGGQPVTSSGAIQDAIAFLHGFEAEYQRTQALVLQLEQERNELSARVRALDNAAATQDPFGPVVSPERIYSDTQTLVEILQRAKGLRGLETKVDGE